MKALVFEKGKLKLVERPVPEPAGDEVLIKVKMAGICNTDLEIMKGYLNFQGIIGHEFTGTVVGADKDDELYGRRVVGSINIPCYHCSVCQQGLYNHCLNIKCLGIRDKDGAFAEYLTLKRENLYPVPDEVNDREAVFTEPVAAAIEIIEKIHIRPTDRVLVLGDGKLGLITAMVLHSVGLEVIVVGKHREKLAVLSDMDIQTYLTGEFHERVQVVIECTGSSSGLETALDLVQPEGKIVLKTTVSGKNLINLSKAAVNELMILGSRCGPFAPALRLLKRNNMALEKMIDSVYRLEDGVKAMERASQKGVLKVLLENY
ncbi:MAG: alcohol dehydrogenase catalytic domain-containing protein [Halanaerobiaceae bacterium]|jgi:threonine dehydrogenase-like Zn-dependent dehydrogenase|nr:alcohol dehydrogenase catalytic domain-containing protein [Halanaerobiaceae bacterium]